jgi:hypothetical protein
MLAFSFVPFSAKFQRASKPSTVFADWWARMSKKRFSLPGKGFFLFKKPKAIFILLS